MRCHLPPNAAPKVTAQVQALELSGPRGRCNQIGNRNHLVCNPVLLKLLSLPAPKATLGLLSKEAVVESPDTDIAGLISETVS